MKKGFTLIEMIATVVIIAIISIVIVLGIKAIREKENDKQWNQTVNRITSAADSFTENNVAIKTEIYDSGKISYIPITEIVEAGLLDENELVDARDSSKISDKEDIYQKVKVYLNNGGALEFEYPAIKGKYIVFDSRQIYIKAGTTLDCFDGVHIYNENDIEIDKSIVNKVEIPNTDITVTTDYKATFNDTGDYEIAYYIDKTTYLRKVKVYKVDTLIYQIPGQYFTSIGTTGTYRITVSGSQGAGGSAGGTISGEVLLTKGTDLEIIVGGKEGKYGGGKGESNGGDSSRIIVNDEIIIIGAGGGGGAKGTVGGNDNGFGGTNQGSGAGTNGISGSGGGSSYTHKYDCNCQTCGGGCNGWESKTCGCYSCCKAWFRLPCGGWSLRRGGNVRPSICPKPVCIKTGSCGCYSCKGDCNSWAPTYSCHCKTCTKVSLPGKGGKNFAASNIINVQNTIGNNATTGKIIIEFVK